MDGLGGLRVVHWVGQILDMFSRGGISFKLRYAHIRGFFSPCCGQSSSPRPLYAYWQNADIQRVDIFVLVVGAQAGAEYRLDFDTHPLESFCAPCGGRSGSPPLYLLPERR